MNISGVVAEDGDHGAGDQVERAFVGRAGDVVWGGGGGPENIAEIILDGDRVLLGPTGPGAAQDAGAVAVTDGVVAQIKAGLISAEDFLRGCPRDDDVVRFLGISLVAGEIPHAGEVIEGNHVTPPRPEVFVGVAFHDLEGAAHDIPELRSTIGRQRGVTGLPGFLVEVGLDGVHLLQGGWSTGVVVSLRHSDKYTTKQHRNY